MGIVNVTPDSFYTANSLNTFDSILKVVEKMLVDGATIIDIGGQTTKPGSQTIGVEAELKRVLPAIEAVSKNFPDCYISIDTYHAKVADESVQAGACIVNDVSGGKLDAAMLSTVGQLNVPYICMHMQGVPSSMQDAPVYTDVVQEVLDYFIHQIPICLSANIKDVILDVGFGFGKTLAHNFQLLHQLSTFKMLDKPIMAGVSRKSMLYKTLGTNADEALNATTVANTIALLNGANILRVHDVKEAVEAINLVRASEGNL